MRRCRQSGGGGGTLASQGGLPVLLLSSAPAPTLMAAVLVRVRQDRAAARACSG